MYFFSTSLVRDCSSQAKNTSIRLSYAVASKILLLLSVERYRLMNMTTDLIRATNTVDVRSLAPLFVLSRVLKLHNIILICA
jgi:hypothetical protein